MRFFSSAGQEPTATSLSRDPQEGTSLTRFCLSLRTRLFSLDFVWGRLRTNSPALTPAPAPPRSGGIRLDAVTAAALRQRDEIERRWHLAALLNPAVPRSMGMPASTSIPATNPRPICRAYALAAAGRLKADSPTS